MLNDVGSTKHANYISKLIIKLDNKLLKLGRDYLNLPPISYYQFKDRIGELVSQTAATKHLAKLGMIKEKPVLPITDTKHLINSAFLPYLNDSFNVVMPGEEAEFYRNYARSSPFNTCHTRWEQSIQGHYSSTAKYVHKKLKVSKNKSVAFKLKMKHNRCRTFSKEFWLTEMTNLLLCILERGYFDQRNMGG